jgi:hypothetical protein
MTRHELDEGGLIAHGGGSHQLAASDRHRVHHAIEIPLEAGSIQNAPSMIRQAVHEPYG